MVVNRAKRCEDVADPRGYGHGRNDITVEMMPCKVKVTAMCRGLVAVAVVHTEKDGRMGGGGSHRMIRRAWMPRTTRIHRLWQRPHAPHQSTPLHSRGGERE